MRKNRKRHARVKVLPPSVVGFFVLLVSMILCYWFMDSKCAQLGQEIRKHEQKFSALENERVREEARWNAKKTPEKLERAMLQHGLDMNYPTATQVVRMDAATGAPVPGQLSVIAFRRSRNAGERVAGTVRK